MKWYYWKLDVGEKGGKILISWKEFWGKGSNGAWMTIWFHSENEQWVKFEGIRGKIVSVVCSTYTYIYIYM